MEQNNLVITNDGKAFESEMKKFTTLDLTEKENQVKLYNSLQECDVRVNDIVGQTIEIAGVYIEERPVFDEETGETSRKFRTILYGADGKTYVTGAYGVYNSLQTILSIFGNPSSENTISVVVGKKALRNGKESLILTVQ